MALAASAAADKPRIWHAESEVQNGALFVTIAGQDLSSGGQTPAVLLGGLLLTVNTWSTTDIQATAPGVLKAGSYLLAVSPKGRHKLDGDGDTAWFTLNVGGDGPAGPQGPRGDVGPMGPAGPAGIQGPIGPLHEANPRLWAEAMNTNLLGVMHACRAVLPHMVEHRSGKIIVLSGEGATRPRPFFSAYAASKAAIVRLVETLAEEVREYDIQVNCIGPGKTYTHMTDQVLHAGERAGLKAHQEALDVRNNGGVPPEKQIQLALFLASEQSNHLTGKLIHVNDDWKRLENSAAHPDAFTLRRIQRV
jgi:hypothetical protein